MPNENQTIREYKAAEILHHRYLTGLILRTIVTRGSTDAAELVFRLFRRQQQATLLPGIEKLGLSGLPAAVKCAQYHFLSNFLGDVNVEYMYESDKKAWVRYPPPRWIWDGTAICAIPTEVSRAMMRGWHAHNGVTLNNPRLGWVCTKQTVDGQPGLEGYFQEYDHDLSPDERLRFAPEEESPEFDSKQAPVLEAASWPEARIQKALRNYAMQYIRNILPEMLKLFGPEETRNLAATTARLIGMQYYKELAALLGVGERGVQAFGVFAERIGRGEGDTFTVTHENDVTTIAHGPLRVFSAEEALHCAIYDAWLGLWRGLLDAHNRRLRLRVTERIDQGDNHYEWKVW